MQILKWVIILATIEKMLQHSLTAVFFVFSVPSIGTPDNGTRFVFDNPTMAMLNLLMVLLFVAGFYGFLKNFSWGIWLVAVPAAADIVLEFMFHGLFFVTVSVIVSAVLVAACTAYVKQEKWMPVMGDR